jgi:membrane fusion protein (multidrug efflux system)
MTAENEPAPKPTRPFYKHPVRMFIILVIVLGGAAFALRYYLHARHYESTDDAFIEGHIILISPKISATIVKVNVDDNQFVHKGDVLVELDSRDFAAALKQADGNLASMQGKLAEANSQVDVANAQVGEAGAELAVAQTNADNAQRDLDRWLALDERARSKEQLDNSTSLQKSTSAQVAQAQAHVTEAKANVVNAQKAIQTAQANVQTGQAEKDQAELNLSYCTIAADSDGIITRKTIEPGMYVQVDQGMFSIVPTDVWVTANFKETQLADMAPGQEVDITADAYPDRKITGKIESIQNGTGAKFALLPPENATGNYVKVVQRVPVKIVLDPGQNDDLQHLLSPGMSVEPEVKVH